ncbi:hypothetical protein AB4Z22_06325 [Paenibacillus sp. TAF58]
MLISLLSLRDHIYVEVFPLDQPDTGVMLSVFGLVAIKELLLGE